MKKLLLLCLMGTGITFAKAQTYFTQNFSTAAADAAAVGTAYLDANPSSNINNKFTHQWGGNQFTKKVENGKLIFTRSGSGVGSDNKGGIVRTNLGGAGANGNFEATAPKFLKVSFEFSINATSAPGGLNYNANMCIFQIGSGLSSTDYNNSNPTPPTTTNVYAEIAPSVRKDNGTTFIFSKPVGAGNIGTGSDRTSEITGGNTPRQIEWYLNNTGSEISYTGADGNTHTLPNDTWDLFIGGARVLNDITATSATLDMQNIAIAFTGIANASTVTVGNLEISQPTFTVLPVSLVSFTGKSTTSGNLLEWKTASESNNSHFEIWRSVDDHNFTKVGQVNGKGNSTVPANYTFVDKTAAAGNTYYKLKQVDFDGKSEEFGPVTVKTLANETQFAIVAKENGELDVSYLASSADNNAILKIFDLNGRTLVNKTLSVQKGYNKIVVPAVTAKGLLVGTINSNQQNSSIKFLK